VAALTCSSVSCHGGQTTPNWRTGTIASATQCTACHGVAATAGTIAQFNDAFGRHSQGTHNATNAANAIACTTCHAMSNGSPGAIAHFKYLNTPAVDGTSGAPPDQLPSGTIVFDTGIVSGSRTYTTNSGTQGNGGCALTCHTHVHVATAETWQGLGVSHAIPFGTGVLDSAGNGHFTVTQTTFNNDCASCHSYTGTSPNPTAPLCSVCHTLANPLVAATGAATCLSCHSGASGLPAGPVGTVFPGITGAHPKHTALPNVSCNTCHTGRGTGTGTHYTNANLRLVTPVPPAALSIDATFSAKNGSSPAYTGSNFTCSSVRCHGGQVTPAWRGGTINSATQCTLCHNVATTSLTATQYNDAFGRHSQGTHNALTASGVACTTCHNMANATPGALAHFKYLNTVAVDLVSGGPSDQKASDTIVFDPLLASGARTYTTNAGTQGNGGCALTCHTHIHTATVNMWTSVGVPHPKPFLAGGLDNQNNGHLTVTAAQFAADCKDCHAYSGASPVALAPLCSTCHTLADPTLVASGAGTCLSCHAGTPGLQQGPGGLSFPSNPGAHAKHMGLATTLTCNTCHAGRGSTTLAHYNNANVRLITPAPPTTLSLDVTYNAKTAGATPTATYTGSSQTCSSVSCHGGQVTPTWQGGTLNASTQCTSCHGVAATFGTILQHNDAFGRHSQGTHNALTATGVACTTCHDMANNSPGATSHFKYLNTTAVDGVAAGGTPADELPSGTISFAASILNGGTGTYNVSVAGTAQGSGACTLTCHVAATNTTHIHTGVPVDTWTASGAPHQVPFLSTSPADAQGNGHVTVTAAAFAADCASCHAYSGTSPNASAPLCQSCHTRHDPTQAGFDVGTCLSCHVGASGLPAGPTDTLFPSIAGAHAKHMALTPETTLTCDSCHFTSGSGTAVHYTNAKTPTVNPALVSIDTVFNAQTGGAATFTPASLTCSNVSCHGGQATPNWRTAGSLNSLTQCSACHAINGNATTNQYNDAVGRHNWGTHNGAAKADCTTCHSMDPSVNTTGNGALNHFAGLELHALSGATKRPSNTIVFKTSVAFPIVAGATYSVTSPYAEADGGCALTCHSQNHVPTAATYHWGLPQGSGAPHPVPFYIGQISTATGNTHQTVTQAQFTSECSGCHEVNNPTSTFPGPTCTKCHTLGSPFASALGTCLSCHVGANFSTKGPQGLATQIWPNTPGAHAKHINLLTFTRGTQGTLSNAIFANVCATCHLGSLPGDTLNTHYANARKTVTTPVSAGPAPVNFDATFKSKNGAGPALNPSFTGSNLTCSNVSCHGGKATPAWTSTYTVNTASYCLNCHAISSSANYNDARGTHSSGSHPSATCAACHDMSTTTNNTSGVINHFKYLDTPVAAQSADQLSRDTIKIVLRVGGAGNGMDAGGTYTPSATVGSGTCALTCHVGGNNKTHGPAPGNDSSWTSTP
jgi:predicted CxxxxCH...CXXCH cytochrome family protein